MNPELRRLFETDQGDRLYRRPRAEVIERDLARRRRVLQLLDAGEVREPEDMFHAAMVLQHSVEADDYRRAHELAKQAAERGHRPARQLAAAALDRWLMDQGRPQKYGTQSISVSGRHIDLDVDPATTDEERAQWDVPPMRRPASIGQRWAEIDLGAIRHNVRSVLQHLPATTRVLAVVKADGYGHGAYPVAKAALDAGAWGLAVSTPAEAAALRDLVEPERLLAMGGLTLETAPEALGGCAVTCHSVESFEAMQVAAPSSGRLHVHLKVDTGMGRIGCRPEEAVQLARRIAGSDRLRLAGVYSHFASADGDEAFTRAQFERLQEVLGTIDVDPGLRHIANSAAALRHPDMALDAIRLGIGLYGCEWPGLRPALALRGLITQVKDVPAGATVGYGREWVAERPSQVATVALGYADGVMRSRGGRGEVVVAGRRAPVVGRISMDQMSVDVTEVPEARTGMVATVIGDGITAEEVAGWSATISYEVLTAIGPRVSRIYRE